MLRLQKPRVVIFIEYYLPGFRAGGPMRSVSALVDQLGDEIEFYVITRDRDAGSDQPYPAIHAGEWKSLGKGKVRYLAPREMSARHLTAALREIQPHAVYLNSVFAPMSVGVLLARRFGALKGIPILLAPRGELSPGALKLKAFKKGCFIKIAHLTQLHRDVVFHASTERERDEIAQAIPIRDMPRIARNPVAADSTNGCGHSKVAGAVRFVFVSRISRKKNLHLAIELLRLIRGSVVFDICGPVLDSEDQAYWQECLALIAQMPQNVTVKYCGPIAHDLVVPTLSDHDFFLFPTASENFGHAIVEALLAGCPVITSDQTPWRGLAQRGAGWDLPLDGAEAWRYVMQTCVDMDAVTYARASLGARSFGNEIVSVDTVVENRRLFRSMFKEGAGVRRSPGISVA
jgi:glycosyltransferase involved in cell wall biosynthesis